MFINKQYLADKISKSVFEWKMLINEEYERRTDNDLSRLCCFTINRIGTLAMMQSKIVNQNIIKVIQCGCEPCSTRVVKE